jgi:hypothetical protein
VERVRVKWPRGGTQVVTDVTVNGYHTIEEH